MGSEYDGMTASELLDIVRKTWIEYDLQQAIGSAPPDEDYIGAHIIDCAVYATPADETADLKAQLSAALEREATLREALRDIETEITVEMERGGQLAWATLQRVKSVAHAALHNAAQIARRALDGAGREGVSNVSDTEDSRS